MDIHFIVATEYSNMWLSYRSHMSNNSSDISGRNVDTGMHLKKKNIYAVISAKPQNVRFFCDVRLCTLKDTVECNNVYKLKTAVYKIIINT